ncbi:hypothetical protein DM02DRAFT_710861 [Periconia macrospinosa]|uniref:Uncharacterized protein n=1 Tax=Periconia macrospinosa TaxID=97972 RepID=A0A2V1E8T8_9PLEO|nr:hypothetical protein DM02DRAFT_710861 [Periconia macrospinosa]
MVCTVIKQQRGTNEFRWFCCYCGNGPMSVKLQPRCTECDIQHALCHGPASSQKRNFVPKIVDGASKDHEPKEPRKSDGPPSICSDWSENLFEHDEPMSSADSCSSDDEIELDLDVHDKYGLAAFEVAKAVIFDALAFYPDAHAFSSDQDHGLVYLPGGIAQSPNSNGQTKDRRRRSKVDTGKKLSPREDYEQEPERETPHAQRTRVKGQDKPRHERENYACPFLKYNAHRYRHFKACDQPYSISELKTHLTRKNSPHELRLDDGHDALQQPVEGIGDTLKKTISQLRCPSVDNNPEVEKKWWYDLYRLLFGNDAELPECYYDVEDIRRSNNIELQSFFRERFIGTLQRGLPPVFTNKVVRCHLRSILEAEAQHCAAQLVGKQYSCSYDAVMQRMDVGPSRRKSRGTEPQAEAEPQPLVTDRMDLDYAQSSNNLVNSGPIYMSSQETGQNCTINDPEDIAVDEQGTTTSPYPNWIHDTQFPPAFIDNQEIPFEQSDVLSTEMVMFDTNTDIQSLPVVGHGNTHDLSLHPTYMTYANTGHQPQMVDPIFPGLPDFETTREEERQRVISAEKGQEIPQNIGDVDPFFGFYTQGILQSEPESILGSGLLDAGFSSSQVRAMGHQPEDFDFDAFPWESCEPETR